MFTTTYGFAKRRDGCFCLPKPAFGDDCIDWHSISSRCGVHVYGHRVKGIRRGPSVVSVPERQRIVRRFNVLPRHATGVDYPEGVFRRWPCLTFRLRLRISSVFDTKHVERDSNYCALVVGLIDSVSRFHPFLR